MVEIKRKTTEDLSTGHHEDSDGSKYRLLYTKSKVYVNPTAYARDNIPGFVAIVKRVRHRPQLGEFACVLILPSCVQEAANPTHLLAWIPESLLDEKGQSEWDKFVSVEGKAPYDEEEGESIQVPLGTALIASNTIRCCPHRHADFATRDIRILRAPDLCVLLPRLPPKSIFLV